MARKEPSLYHYGEDDYHLSTDARSVLSREFGLAFSGADFAEIEAAFSICAAVFKTRKEALDREQLADVLQSIARAAGALLRLIDPTTGMIRTGSSKLDRPLMGRELLTVEEALLRIRSAISESPELIDVFPKLRQDLGFLATIADSASERVRNLPTLSRGPDAEHHDYLLRELRSVLSRRGLQTSYSSDAFSDKGKTSKLVDFACSAARLVCDDHGKGFPTEAMPKPEALVRRLEVIRAAEKKEGFA